jgi:hypothetical protein
MGFELTNLVVMGLIAQVVVNPTTIWSRPRWPLLRPTNLLSSCSVKRLLYCLLSWLKGVWALFNTRRSSSVSQGNILLFSFEIDLAEWLLTWHKTTSTDSLLTEQLDNKFVGRRRGHRGRDHMVVGFTTTCAISPITTKFVSSNLIHGKVTLIQYYVIKFVSDLRQVCGSCTLLYQYYWYVLMWYVVRFIV